MALFATAWHARGGSAGGTVVATVMSNLGLETVSADKRRRSSCARRSATATSSRDAEKGLNLGGEQSGHIVFLDHATTGDGLMAALQVLATMVDTGKPLSEVAHVFDPAPQKLVNRPYKGGDPLAKKSVKDAIADAEKLLGQRGRLLVRRSGTEPIVRVMAQAETEDLVKQAVDGVVAALDAA